MRMTAHFPTARATALLGTMAKHFGHKITVTLNDGDAVMEFPAGQAQVQATDAGLDFAIQAADADALERLRDVLESHLMRFAHRDDPAPLVWTQPT